VKDVIFYRDGISQVGEMFYRLYCVMNEMPKIQIEYTDEEFLQHFNLHAWRGMERIRMQAIQKEIKQINSSYSDGLALIFNNGIEASGYSTTDFQEIIYAAIQQNYAELQRVYDSFCSKYGDEMCELDDFTATMEVRKMVLKAQDRFRSQAKAYLDTNPDDSSDWRNYVRRCQYCGEVWVKVEGCDGSTTCGNIPSGGDGSGAGASFRWIGKMVKGIWRWEKNTENLNPVAARSAQKSNANNKRAGCGREIVWSNQQVVPIEEFQEEFLTVAEFGNVLESMRNNEAFVRARRQADEGITAEQKFGGFHEATLDDQSERSSSEDEDMWFSSKQKKKTISCCWCFW